MGVLTGLLKDLVARLVEWDAQFLDDRPDQFIAWQSLENSDVENSGSVEFRTAPGNRGTSVTVELN